MAINKISEFPKVTPSAEDKILIEKNGEGGHINLSEMPISTPVEKKISDVQKDLNDRITALAFEPGDTTGDAELKDIRKPAAGFTVPANANAGDAVRAQVTQLDGKISELKGDLVNFETFIQNKENLFDTPAMTDHKFIDVNGVETNAQYFAFLTVSEYIEIPVYVKSIKLHIGQNEGTNVISFYSEKSEDTFISGINEKNQYVNDFIVEVPNGAKYYRICNNSEGNVEKVSIDDITIIYVLKYSFEEIYEKNNSHWNGKKSGFLGDSITYGVYNDASGGGTTDRQYWKVASDILGMNSIGYGYSGTSISSTTNVNPSNSFVNRYSAMSDDLDLVCVLGGTNDYATSVPLGTIADKTDVSFYGAMNVLCDGLINKYKGKTIVFITPLLRDYQNKGEGTNDLGYTLNDIRQAIYDVASGVYGLKVIDGKQLGITPFNANMRTEYIYDGLHPNPIGHNLIGNNLAHILNAI